MSKFIITLLNGIELDIGLIELYEEIFKDN